MGSLDRHLTRVMWGAVLAGALLAVSTARADLFSKKYQFRAGVILEVAASTEDGLRLDSVRFYLPATIEGRVTRTGGLVGAEVAVSNLSQEARKVGVALALFDEAGRLLGVASGGNKVASIKPNRQKTFALIFHGVNAEAPEATVFQVSLESK